MSKKILITAEGYYPSPGGIQQFILGLSEFLSAQGYEIFVYTKADEDHGLVGMYVRPEARVMRSTFMSGSMEKPFSVLKHVSSFAAFISEHNIDVVFANNHNSLAWIQAAHRAKVPVIYGCHGVGLMDPFKRRFLLPSDEIIWGFPSIKDVFFYLKELYATRVALISRSILFFAPFVSNDRIKNYWRYKKAMRILDSADARYANSSLTASLFNNKNNTFGFPLPINASNSKFSHHYFPKINEQILGKFGLTHKEYILCPGRINVIKGQWYALESLKNIKNTSLKLVFAGGRYLEKNKKYSLSAYEKKLHTYITEHHLEDRVIFTGHLDFEDMQSLYSSALVTVIPSIWLETFGYVTLESFACATPAIVTNNCGSALCVTDETGCVVMRKDAEALADQINTYEHDFIGMGLAARKEVLEKYDWKVLGKKFVSLFEEIKCN